MPDSSEKAGSGDLVSDFELDAGSEEGGEATAAEPVGNGYIGNDDANASKLYCRNISKASQTHCDFKQVARCCTASSRRDTS